VTAIRTLKLVVAYDGTNYVGWQRQASGTSVQELLERAFAPFGDDPAAAPGVAGAGRTDAGVHAQGQVASVNVTFDVPAPAVQRALNIRLPPDVRVIDVADAPPGFHARFHATGKAYRYRIATAPVLSPFERWFVWHSPVPRDVEAMRNAATRLVGRHDFASFQARGSWTSSTVRTVTRLEILERPGEIVIEIEADGFLRHMVRALAGTLAEVGAGGRRAASLSDVLHAHDRRAAGPTAPAAGLTLVGVRY